jgi:glycosyltransferase involved in cell wall biosynthesis
VGFSFYNDVSRETPTKKQLMKKVLFIAYYFPPLGMGGVQRSLKFIKYLPEFGWNPVVFTTGTMAYYAYDKKLLLEIPSDITIYRSNLFNPLSIPVKAPQQKVTHRQTPIFNKLKSIFSYLTILDNKLYWSIANVFKIISICKKEKIACIYSSSPPHSIHILSLVVGKFLNIPYIADFRDDWVGGILDQSPTPFHDKIADVLLKLILRKAAFVTATSRFIAQSLAERAQEKEKMFHVKHPKYLTITNGYDEKNFTNFQNKKTGKFTIVYSGSFTPVHHPYPFLAALRDLIQEHPQWKNDIVFYHIGKYFGLDFPSLVEKNGLEEIVKFKGYLPHSGVMEFLEKSDLLLLTLTMGSYGKSIIPGKLFEYFRAGKPILAIAPEEGAVAELIQQTNSGSVCNEDNISGIKNVIKQNYLNWKNHIPIPTPKNITQFERKKLTKTLSEILYKAINR